MVVKRESPLKTGVLFLIAGLLGILEGVFASRLSLLVLDGLHRGLFYVAGIGLIGTGLLLLAPSPRWQRLNQRRQTAAQGDMTLPLAPIQPPLSEASFHLPLQITPRRNWPHIVQVYLPLTCILGFALFGRDLSDALSSGDLGIAIFGLIATPVLGGLYMISWLRRQSIEATTDMLKITSGGGRWWSFSSQKEQVIRWDDARLFALYGGKPGQPGTCYELASADVSLEWRDYRQQRWWVLQRADERYTEQMGMLLAYISARTGLPLYDLR
ncbi:MAG TPA: hypothetical protein VH540_01895 [Ktedonobacterales bacterium]